MRDEDEDRNEADLAEWVCETCDCVMRGADHCETCGEPAPWFDPDDNVYYEEWYDEEPVPPEEVS